MPTSSQETPLNLQRLSYFVAIVEERSFTRAAERFGISQPALSRQIAVLEGELGVSLLERTTSGVLPTAIGRDVLVEAQLTLASAQRISQAVRDSMHMQLGRLEIATFPTLVTGALLPAIRSWHDRYPNVTVHLREFRSRFALQEAVRLGAVDIAIGVKPDDWSGPQQLLGVTQLVIVLPARDPLLSRPGPIRLERLAHRQWVLYDRAYGLADVLDAVFEIVGLKPTPVVETSQAEAAARLAAAGLGPALVPLANVPPELKKNCISFEPAIAHEVHAFARRRWSASARAFLEIVAEDKWPPIPEGAHRISLRHT